ncbi:MAG: nucleotidyl transferase AbiEii/AbiGii toxin family protein [Planctomycetaceae bacterium]|nr:nucleotidyl transferase AbiEii/AbiGii toxin family protein [Planctomycetaceae bacterium]
MSSEKTAIKSWVDQWKTTGPALREVWVKELQSPDYGRKIEQLIPLLRWACANALPKPISGLAEQQKDFRAFHNRQQKPMIDLFQAAKELTLFFQTRRWEYVFIGGLAVVRWGHLRTTTDIDVTLLTRYTEEEKFVSATLDRFQARIDDAFEFAMKNRVLLVKATNGIDMDISLGGLPFEERMVQRSSEFLFTEESSIRTCSAEDLIVLKAFAGRDKDWSDIDSILVRQQGRLDFGSIFDELAPLCEMREDDSAIRRLKEMIP